MDSDPCRGCRVNTPGNGDRYINCAVCLGGETAEGLAALKKWREVSRRRMDNAGEGMPWEVEGHESF